MKVAIILACLAAAVLSAPSSRVDPALSKLLSSGKTSTIIISFKEGTSKVIDSLNVQTFATREQRLVSVGSALKSNAQKSQSRVLDHLARARIPYQIRQLWISNQIAVYDADLSIVESLAQFDEISEIAADEEFPLEEKRDFVVYDKKENRPLAEWGVDKIQAPQAWALDGGNNGAGVIVANIDTGVRVTHEALRDNFRGTYGWFDPYPTNTQAPNDNNGHGTHTMGTIAGNGGIGVAPGSTWMACRGCSTSSCTTAALTACGQFMLCPTLANGQAEDCTKAPHLVSNSWGGGQGQTMYNSVISAWNAAGIVPLFSNGNSGPSCGTANSPADNPLAIGIGSTTVDDAISSFSSKGPSITGLIKPDVSAPGSNVYSAYYLSDTSYSTLSGTSMSCPHAAGAVALLKSRNNNLTIPQVKSYLLYGNADVSLIKPNLNCGGVSESVFPNNAFGQGRINVFNSLLKLVQDS